MTMKTTRRAVLAGAAALPALAVPALASAEIDPVFTAIDEHRRLWDAHNAAYAAVPRGEKAREAEEFAGDCQSETHDQLASLLEMTPTTAAGCIAALRYIGTIAQEGEYDNANLFHEWDTLSVPASTFLSRIADALAKAVHS